MADTSHEIEIAPSRIDVDGNERASGDRCAASGDSARAAGRIACAAVPALPLQLVLREHPEWKDDAVVVVEDDRPQARILWANRAARGLRVERGMCFGQAEAIASRLRAAVVPEARIAHGVDELLILLLRFSPNVEPAAEQPGVFWVDANGLDALFSTLDAWARAVHAAIESRGFVASVAVGFERYGVYAVARTRTGWLVMRDAADERRRAEAVPLARLDVSPALRDHMALLGVHTLGDFVRLPAGDLLLRYGAEAARLHRAASGEAWAPLAPELPVLPVRVEVDVDPPDDDLHRLLFALKGALHAAAARIEAKSEAVAVLRLTLRLDGAAAREERIEAAAPTLDVLQLLDLVRLRLEPSRLAAPVERIAAEFESVRVHPRQLELLKRSARRDLDAARRALARVKAAFGADAVTRARLVERHLPEASFRWEPVSEVRFPRRVEPAAESPAAAAAPPLMRALFATPVALSTMPANEPERWLGVHGAVQRMHGPFRTSGGWWLRRVERDYYYIETERGEILYVYFDRRRRRWFLHGLID